MKNKMSKKELENEIHDYRDMLSDIHSIANLINNMLLFGNQNNHDDIVKGVEQICGLTAQFENNIYMEEYEK